MNSFRPERSTGEPISVGRASAVRVAGALRVVVCAARGQSGKGKVSAGVLRKAVDWYHARDGSRLSVFENEAAMADATMRPDLVLIDLDPKCHPIGGFSGVGRWIRNGAFVLCTCGTGEGEKEYYRLKGLLREGAFEFLSSRRLGFKGILVAIRQTVARLELLIAGSEEGKVTSDGDAPFQLAPPEESAGTSPRGGKVQGLLFDADVA